jgi:hypothetical protein
LQYADKGTFFGHEGMVVRAALTCIDNNKNLTRMQATTSDGTARFNAISRRLLCLLMVQFFFSVPLVTKPELRIQIMIALST